MYLAPDLRPRLGGVVGVFKANSSGKAKIALRNILYGKSGGGEEEKGGVEVVEEEDVEMDVEEEEGDEEKEGETSCELQIYIIILTHRFAPRFVSQTMSPT